MLSGAITSYIDVAQLTLYAFWIFFAGLILYLRREDKREGYPLESDRSARVRVQGFPPIPRPKTFLLPHGGTYTAPGGNPDTREVRAAPVAPWPGAPLEPTGDPMLDGVGPAAYALREDAPDLTLDGRPKIIPLRAAPDYFLAPQDPDPRGMEVLGADGRVAGTVSDVWVDRSETFMRYLEVELAAPADPPRTVLVPTALVRIRGRRRQIVVKSVLARHFATAPATQHPEQVTKREEDRISAYYAGGTLYAEPSRLGPVL